MPVPGVVVPAWPSAWLDTVTVTGWEVRTWRFHLAWVGGCIHLTNGALETSPSANCGFLTSDGR